MTTYYVHCHCMCVHLNSIITSSSFFVVALFSIEERKKQLKLFCNTKNVLTKFFWKFVPFALFYIPICRFVSFFLFGKFRFDIELTFLYMDWITSHSHHVANHQCYQLQLPNFPVFDWFLWSFFERLAWYHFPKMIVFSANALLYAQHCYPIVAGSPPTEKNDFCSICFFERVK